MKTFSVKTTNGEALEGEQLATFAHYVQGAQFRFVVLLMPDGSVSLTERGSGKRVSQLTFGCDYVKTGKAVIDQLVEKHGAARVRAVFARG